jgi:hypothetical protein
MPVKDKEKRKAIQRRYEERHRPLVLARKRARNNKRNREQVRDYERHRLYGITPAQYAAMLHGQAGVCAICEAAPPEGRTLCIDHDHDTGAVRGLICRKCNAGLGHARDSVAILNKMAAYLQHSQHGQLRLVGA